MIGRSPSRTARAMSVDRASSPSSSQFDRTSRLSRTASAAASRASMPTTSHGARRRCLTGWAEATRSGLAPTLLTNAPCAGGGSEYAFQQAGFENGIGVEAAKLQRPAGDIGDRFRGRHAHQLAFNNDDPAPVGLLAD